MVVARTWNCIDLNVIFVSTIALSRFHSDQPPYEWYQDYHTLSHLLNPHTLSGTGGHPNMVSMTDRADDASASTAIVTNASAVKVYDCMHPSKCRVLILGCGNSSLGANMFEAGWRGGMTQLDYSSVVIDQMKKRYNDQYYQHLFFGPHAAAANLNIDNNNNKSKQVPKMDFLCLDVTQTPLPFDGGSFDLIICKGLFDALLCSANSVFNVRRFVKDCLRLLNDNGGALMICTYGNPDNRVVFLEDEEGDLTTYWAGVHLHKVPSRIRNSNSKNGSNHGPIK